MAFQWVGLMGYSWVGLTALCSADPWVADSVAWMVVPTAPLMAVERADCWVAHWVWTTVGRWVACWADGRAFQLAAPSAGWWAGSLVAWTAACSE